MNKTFALSLEAVKGFEFLIRLIRPGDWLVSTRDN
jgi:hypothetical protein